VPSVELEPLVQEGEEELARSLPDLILSGDSIHQRRISAENVYVTTDVAARQLARKFRNTESFIGLSRVAQGRLNDLYGQTAGMTNVSETLAEV